MTISDSSTDPLDEANPAWVDLAADYERARSRDDSLDRLAEWPAQRKLLGDVVGKSFYDERAHILATEERTDEAHPPRHSEPQSNR